MICCLWLKKASWCYMLCLNRYAKANNKYMKDCDSSTKSSYTMYWDVNNIYKLEMSQKLPVDDFKWKMRSLNSLRNSTRLMMTSVKDTSSRLMLVILSIHKTDIVISCSCQKELKLTNSRNFSVVCMTRKVMSYT